jgi:hypothetical protein
MLLKLVTVIGTVTTEPGVQVDALPKFTEIWAWAEFKPKYPKAVEMNTKKAEKRAFLINKRETIEAGFE